MTYAPKLSGLSGKLPHFNGNYTDAILIKPREITLPISVPMFRKAASRYEDILNEIRAHLPQASLHLMAYYPVNEPVGLKSPFMGEVRHRTNRRIQEANEAVKALAARVGGAYHDFNAGLTDEV